MHVLVVEDERTIAQDLSRELRDAGYIVELSHDGEDGWFQGDSNLFDAIILDLGLPILDGLTVLKRWRKAGISTPVIALTARDGWENKVDAIDAGADDYLTKPFRVEELLARLRAITRRSVGQRSSVLKNGDLELDTCQRAIAVAGNPISVTPLEYRLVSYLMHHPGRVISQTELSGHIHDSGSERDSNAIEALVSRLRRKLGTRMIETRRGHGYILLSRNEAR